MQLKNSEVSLSLTGTGDVIYSYSFGAILYMNGGLGIHESMGSANIEETDNRSDSLQMMLIRLLKFCTTGEELGLSGATLTDWKRNWALSTKKEGALSDIMSSC